MIDKEKVIAGLTMLADRKNDDTCEGLKCCKIAEDALTLLKEREVKQINHGWVDEWYGLVYACPNCEAEWMSDTSETHFCPNCGQEVEWNDNTSYY